MLLISHSSHTGALRLLHRLRRTTAGLGRVAAGTGRGAVLAAVLGARGRSAAGTVRAAARAAGRLRLHRLPAAAHRGFRRHTG